MALNPMLVVLGVVLVVQWVTLVFPGGASGPKEGAASIVAAPY